jgi:hypothetical protein
VALSGGAEAHDDTPGLQVLEDCYGIWQELGKPADVIGSLDLIKRLKELPVRPWGDYHGGKGITPTWLARRLKSFDVYGSGNVRYEGKQCKGYRWPSFTDPWERYAVFNPSQRTNPNESGPELAILTRPTESGGTDAKSGVSPMNTGLWDSWTASERNPGSDGEWGEM